MLNIAICDDESAERAYIREFVRQWASARMIDVHLSDHESAENFLFVSEHDTTIDILLLDIQMKGMDGVELARHIRKDNEHMQIVFITGYPDFIAQGYDVAALHYLMKPVNESKLFEVLDKAVKRLKNASQTLLVQTQDGAIKIPLEDILYVEAFAHYIAIQTKTACIETRATISDTQRSLGHHFVRCHRSYIVGLKHISRITKTDVILDNGKTIPLSRRLYTETNLAFIEYHKGRA